MTPQSKIPAAQQKPEEPSVTEDVIKSGASGVAQGVIGGTVALPGDMASLAQRFNRWLYEDMGAKNVLPQSWYEETKRAENPEWHAPTTEDVTHYIDEKTGLGTGYQPKTMAGRGTQFVGQLAGGYGAGPAVGTVRGLTRAEAGVRLATDLGKHAVGPGVVGTAADEAIENYVPEGKVKDVLKAVVKPLVAGGTSVVTSKLPTPAAATPNPGYHPGATDRIVAGTERQGGPAAVQAELSQVGPEARLYDVDALRHQADALAQLPGTAQQQIVQDVRARHAQAGDRIGDSVNRNLGEADAFAETQRQRIADARREQNDLYDQARAAGPGSQNVDTRPILAHIDREIPTNATLEQSALTPTEQALLRVRGQLQNRTDVNSLHRVKTGLDDDISNLYRNGRGNDATALRQVRDQLVEQLDSATETTAGDRSTSLYRRARDRYAGDAAITDATNAGVKVFNDANESGADFRARFARMRPDEQAGMQQGARQQMTLLMENARNDATAVRQMFEKEGNQIKLRVLFGEERANDLLTTLRQEGRMAGTHQTIVGGSQTAGRQAAMEEIPKPPENRSFSSLPTPGQILVGVGNKMLSPFRRMQANRAATIQEDMARMLTTRGADQAALLQRLAQVHQQAGQPLGGPNLPPGFAAALSARAGTMSDQIRQEQQRRQQQAP